MTAESQNLDPAAGQHVMQCMEVWGGNQVFDSSLALPGLDAWVYSRPYAQAAVGGDVYYVSSCATGRITRLLVADVTGHGKAVGDLAVGLRTLMRRFVNYIDQGRFVREMNGQFAELSRRGNFATAVVTTFFGPTRKLSICNAGHPPPLIYRAATGRWSFLENSARDDDPNPANLPLGILELSDYDVFDTDLDVGDLVVCYTDSLPESFDEEGKMLGQAGLLREVAEVPVGEPATLVGRILEHIRSLYASNLDGDDVTVLLFRPNGTANSTPLSERLLAPFRIAKAMVRSITHKDEPIPWPEVSVANVGGAVIPSLSKPGATSDPTQSTT
ncbi:PP2C family protein-serine/threonine phosphatase [Humisphaera borealis]|uniref:Serine/threonine-protein phosphatase n=1 Tax=Humisphaera borealis TaxID=2807512 RepID=A0A7M2WPY5_9BACT|nr:PP2C family protein-serine/threonine phosphatase [Humisphaera borealis]QOV87312.1 serine/threonine-protein phosphatase [Humisphaera borealis]